MFLYRMRPSREWLVHSSGRGQAGFFIYPCTLGAVLIITALPSLTMKSR
jgi:hypothetical protein